MEWTGKPRHGREGQRLSEGASEPKWGSHFKSGHATVRRSLHRMVSSLEEVVAGAAEAWEELNSNSELGPKRRELHPAQQSHALVLL